jgi:hypothetical protein
MILSKVRDPRLTTIRRGGTLTDADHHLLALWAPPARNTWCICPRRFGRRTHDRGTRSSTPVPGVALGEVKMMEALAAGGHAMGAARDLRCAARPAAYTAGQAAVVAPVAAHALGAAAYAVKAARAAAQDGQAEAAGPAE